MSAEALQVVFVTAPEEVAPGLAEALVRRGVAACVNVLPAVRSVYRWEGAVETATEALLVAKVPRAGFEALRAAVLELHPYQLPEVIALPVEAAHPAYARWVVDSCAPAAETGDREAP
jgi:periplasmic divalent cation tolerance protein